MRKKIEPGNLIEHVDLSKDHAYFKESIEKIENAKTDIPEIQRLIVVDYSSTKVYKLNKSVYENVIYWSISRVKPMYSTKYFIKYIVDQGITYNRKTKTFRIWNGKHFREIQGNLKKDIFKFLGPSVDFLESVPDFIKKQMSIRLLNKIAKGKITNPKAYIKEYLKEKIPDVEISTELIWKLCKNQGNAENTSDIMLALFTTNFIFKTCANSQALLTHMYNNSSLYNYAYLDSLGDIAKQAFIMDRKLNYCWSRLRLEEEHSKLSREIALIKFSKEPLIDYNYSKPVPHPFITLITNSKELFIEGNGMSHCVYTNYATKVRSKKYFVFHYDDGETFATIGVQRAPVLFVEENYVWVLNQIKSRKNNSVNAEIEKLVKDYLSTEEMQKFFNANSKVTEDEKKDYSIL